MSRKQLIITALAGTERPRVKVIDEQTSRDIVPIVVTKHRDFEPDYDRIAGFFAHGDPWTICEDLWTFCKKNLRYRQETDDVQNVGSPLWILTAPSVDCKSYALFIGGVLDALKRRGYPLVWYYRFVSYRAWSLVDCYPDHVFAVCNPNTDDIWVDPVLDSFNEHLFYFYKINKRMGSTRATRRLQGIAGVGCTTANCSCSKSVGIAPAVSNLLSDVVAYADGLNGNIAQAHRSGAFNQVAEGVLMGVAVAVIPGAAIALAAIKAGAVALDKAFGVGSVSARLVTDIGNLNITGMFNDIFNGRTYQSDQYWAGVYYKFYVLGQNVTDTNHVSDSDVLPALKWFIDRSGVFISGREHIIALTQGAANYAGMSKVNGDTTTDPVLINAASLMAKKFWPYPGNFDPSLRGAWAGTVGVYDNGLVQLANQLNESPEQLAAQTGATDTNAQAYVATQSSNFLTRQLIPGVPNFLLLAGAGLLLLTTKK